MLIHIRRYSLVSIQCLWRAWHLPILVSLDTDSSKQFLLLVQCDGNDFFTQIMCNANKWNAHKKYIKNDFLFLKRHSCTAQCTMYIRCKCAGLKDSMNLYLWYSNCVYCLIIIPPYGLCVYCNLACVQHLNRNNSLSFNNSINKHLAFMLINVFSHLVNVESFKFRKVMYMMSANVYYYLKNVGSLALKIYLTGDALKLYTCWKCLFWVISIDL